jgi:hypothetical protein
LGDLSISPPVSSNGPVIDVGDRTRAMAQRVVHQVVQVLALGCVPLFLTDGFKEYATALLTHYGQWAQSERRQATGPAPKPRWMPLSALLYAQVIKTVRRQPLPLPMPTNGTGSAKQWWPQTPAMAAGLTDRVWTLREVLMFRVLPWPQPQAV